MLVISVRKLYEQVFLRVLMVGSEDTVKDMEEKTKHQVPTLKKI